MTAVRIMISYLSILLSWPLKRIPGGGLKLLSWDDGIWKAFNHQMPCSVWGALLVPLPMRPSGFWILLFLLATPGFAWAADFIGPESCKGCHPEAYSAWQQSKHARAADSLSESQKKDARCLSCHAPDQATQATAHITCETCHGGGQFYAPEYVMKDAELARLVGLVDPSEKMCRTCHDASSPSLRPFNFVESLKAIDHWTPERARRASRAEAPVPPPKPVKK
jgi:hypothetical protein